MASKINDRKSTSKLISIKGTRTDINEIDSNYNYSGFQINQLVNANALFGSNFSLMDSLGIKQRITKSWVLLPAFIQVTKLIDGTSNKKIQTYYGIKLYPTFAAIPAGFAPGLRL